MIGAMVGDIVGSIYEFNNIRTKDFELFKKECFFTDDTVMTVAVADAILQCGEVVDYEFFKGVLVKIMKTYGRMYPYSGYGGRFSLWLRSDISEPYNSFGNGSAMRVSPAGWYAKSLEEAEALAAATAEVTHNHPEGIKGAMVTAGAIFLAREGKSIEQIREYVAKSYDVDFTLESIRDTYEFNETCQETVPQAMVAFFESVDFEDAIRNAISIGGDSDTLAAITGSVAEAFYGIGDDIKEKTLSYLDEVLLTVTAEFCKRFM